jgi:hypothetical protein
MRSRHTRVAHVGLAAFTGLLTVALLAGCGGSSGVHTQTLTSDSRPSTSVSRTPSTSVTTSTASPTMLPSGIPTPTVTVPGAQDAVNAYIAFYNASGAADRDPTDANDVAIDGYLTGRAKTLFDSNYASMKQSGLAYRGTAPDPRVKVQQVFSDTSVFLESCPFESKTDPYVEYTVSTGKQVATGATRNPPPPYLLVLPMVKVGGQWQLSDVLPNTSKTCTG